MIERRIHFVGRHNALRSRLAEAYLKSLKLPGYRITSSGIEADESAALISPFARDIARAHGLTAFMSKTKRQTTADLLKKQDIIIFLSRNVAREAVNAIGYDARKATVWPVDDLKDFLVKNPHAALTETNQQKITARIAQLIFAQTGRFAKELQDAGWSDIYDASNKPLGYQLPVSWATSRKGLWRRSVQAVITTVNGHYVVQKRAAELKFAPNLLDISCAGGVDAGETPRRAIIREIYEELGVRVRPEQLAFIDVRKWSAFHPSIRQYTQTFTYTFHVQLTADDPIFVPDPKEVRDVWLMSPRKVARLIRRRRLRAHGALNYRYKYYADIVKYAKMNMKTAKKAAKVT
jgi:protein-tyrosine-phosphatase/8-oxo-dGTP pyrophosphatase MutT (NUDIX family)